MVFNCKILVYLWNIDFPKKASHSKELPMFGIIVTLESYEDFVGVSHWNIFGIFVETFRQSFSVHFGVLVENFWNLIEMFWSYWRHENCNTFGKGTDTRWKLF